MAADLKIHVVDDAITEEYFACIFSHNLGSKWCEIGAPRSCASTYPWTRVTPPDYKRDTQAHRAWFNEARRHDFAQCPHDRWLIKSPAFYLGELSYLKAMLSDDPDTYIPGPLEKISTLIDNDDPPRLTPEFVKELVAALDEPNTTGYYSVTHQANGLRKFLQSHQNKRIIRIAW